MISELVNRTERKAVVRAGDIDGHRLRGLLEPVIRGRNVKRQGQGFARRQVVK